jgi:hypothetical protein
VSRLLRVVLEVRSINLFSMFCSRQMVFQMDALKDLPCLGASFGWTERHTLCALDEVGKYVHNV